MCWLESQSRMKQDCVFCLMSWCSWCAAAHYGFQWLCYEREAWSVSQLALGLSPGPLSVKNGRSCAFIIYRWGSENVEVYLHCFIVSTVSKNKMFRALWQNQTSFRNQQPTKCKKMIEEIVAVWPTTTRRWRKLKPSPFLYRACQGIISGWLLYSRHLLKQINLLLHIIESKTKLRGS
jgi:hypothetical protein